MKRGSFLVLDFQFFNEGILVLLVYFYFPGLGYRLRFLLFLCFSPDSLKVFETSFQRHFGDQNEILNSAAL